MILELVILNVRSGETEAFEAAFGEAKALIASIPGFDHLELRRCMENDHRYALMVGWDRLEDHMEGFRGSPQFQEWRALLHHFYDPAPTVEHYESFVDVARPKHHTD